MRSQTPKPYKSPSRIESSTGRKQFNSKLSQWKRRHLREQGTWITKLSWGAAGLERNRIDPALISASRAAGYCNLPARALAGRARAREEFQVAYELSDDSVASQRLRTNRSSGLCVRSHTQLGWHTQRDRSIRWEVAITSPPRSAAEVIEQLCWIQEQILCLGC